MALGTLLSSSYLQLLSSLGTVGVTRKPAQSPRNAAQTTSVSPRLAPDTYTPGRSSSDDVSVFGALPYAVPIQTTASADALAAAKQTAQRDAEAAAQAERNNPKDSLVTLSQLSQDMTVLANLMRANAANDSTSQAAGGAANPAESDSIAFAVDTPSGSIAAIASDSATSDGSAATSSVAYVGNDGSVQVVGQGSTTAADGSTKSADVSLDAGASSAAVGNVSASFSADASLSTVAATAQQKMELESLTGSGSNDSTSKVNAFSAGSLSPALSNVVDGSGPALSGYQYSANDAATSAYSANGSGGIDGVWNYDTDAGVSFYA
jgi:hypothetical protein